MRMAPSLEFISSNIRAKMRQISPVSMSISDKVSREQRTKFDEICITFAQYIYTFFNPSQTKNVEYSSLKRFNRQTTTSKTKSRERIKSKVVVS